MIIFGLHDDQLKEHGIGIVLRFICSLIQPRLLDVVIGLEIVWDQTTMK